MDDDVRLKAIRAEAENVHEAAQLASETQFEYSKRWRTVDRWIGTAAALAAVAGVGGLSKLLSVARAGGIAVALALVGAISATNRWSVPSRAAEPKTPDEPKQECRRRPGVGDARPWVISSAQE